MAFADLVGIIVLPDLSLAVARIRPEQIIFDFRKLFGFKRKFVKEQPDRKTAVRAFLAHARAEASRLREALIPLIEEQCLSQAIELRSILERPLKYDDKTDGDPSGK